MSALAFNLHTIISTCIFIKGFELEKFLQIITVIFHVALLLNIVCFVSRSVYSRMQDSDTCLFAVQVYDPMIERYRTLECRVVSCQ